MRIAGVLWRLGICFATAFFTASAVEHVNEVPQTEIANRSIRARVYLPDTDHGYYRGSRFDWAGVIASLTFKGHEYFGPWFDDYGPTIHDCIMGPAEEFRGEDGALGFTAARAGGIFIKIGVGLLRKPDASPYDFERPYQIL